MVVITISFKLRIPEFPHVHQISSLPTVSTSMKTEGFCWMLACLTQSFLNLSDSAEGSLINQTFHALMSKLKISVINFSLLSCDLPDCKMRTVAALLTEAASGMWVKQNSIQYRIFFQNFLHTPLTLQVVYVPTFSVHQLEKLTLPPLAPHPSLFGQK